MFGWLSALFGTGKHQDDPAILAAIEETIDGTDPRLRAVSRYQRKLSGPVSSALDYAASLVSRVPGPITMNRQAFSSDPQVRAFFGSADSMQQIFSQSREMREFLAHDRSGDVDEVYALLVVQREEKTVLGMELKGDIIRKDVQQVVVNFSGHRLVAPAATEAETREQIRELAFKDTVTGALERIVSLKSRRKELEEQRKLLQTKLRMLRAGNDMLSSLLQPVEDLDSTQVTATRQQLEKIEGELQEAVADLGTLDDYLAQVRKALSHPERRLTLKEVSFWLDPMNIKLSEDSAQRGEQIRLMEAEAGEQKAVVLLVKYPRNEMLTLDYGL